MTESCQPRLATVESRSDWAEEIANSVTHGVGLALSMAALVGLVILAAYRETPWHVAGVAIYGASLVGLYGVSTLYHAVGDSRWKHSLRVADHAFIYVLIAGTYTPFTLTVLRGPWGWTLFSLAWAAAVLGVVFKVISSNRFHGWGTALYIAMGWMAVLAARPIVEIVPASMIAWLVAGGALYTGGTLFFHNQRVRFAHAIWHMFVLAGSACHFVAVASLIGLRPV